jgi:NADH-quinone oxidoreductase subunit C
MEKLEEIKSVIVQHCGEVVLDEQLNSTPVTLVIQASKLREVCEVLRTHSSMYFDLLSCITGIDNGPESNSMEVVYHLYSIPYEVSLAIRVELPRDKPEVPSVTSVWQTANWHERETYDLLGIQFEGHPDMRRILMPADWEGHPLRKDYEEPTHYRGMETVRKEED